MTISSANRIAGPYTGNGSTTTFAFSFKVFAAADLQVVQLIVASGLETTLTLNTDYTVTLNQNQNSNPGGSVTLVAGALPSGYTLTITSTISNLQPTDLTNQGGFYPEVITDSLDRATIQIQQISDIGDRAIKVPLSDGAVSGLTLPTAVQRANAFLAFDANGDPVAVTGGTSGAPATVTRQTFSGNGSQTTFALASAPGGLGNSALVYINGICQERSTYSIGGSSLVFSQAPVAGTDNIEFVNFLTTNIGTTDASLVQYTPLGTGAVARSAASRFQEVISVKDFGATADGVTNDATAFTNAATAAGTRDVFVPGGSYAITGTVTGNFYTDSTVTIVGGTVNTINRIGSTLSTTGNATISGNAIIGGNATVGGNLTITGSMIGNETITGDLEVSGGDITTSATGTASVFNGNATTLNVGGAAAAVNIGSTSTGVVAVRNLSMNAGYGSIAPVYGCRAWVNFDGSANTNQAATYSQSGTTVTVTLNAHGYLAGHVVYADIQTGTAVDGQYTITSVATDTFTYTAATSLTTSGNVNLIRSTIRGSGNIHSVTDYGAGRYYINLATAIPDTNYAVMTNSGETSTGGYNSFGPPVANRSTVAFSVYTASDTAAADNASVSIVVFR